MWLDYPAVTKVLDDIQAPFYSTSLIVAIDFCGKFCFLSFKVICAKKILLLLAC